MKRGQKVAKRPNFCNGAKQEKKKPKSSFLASNRPNYQPCVECFEHMFDVLGPSMEGGTNEY